MTRGAFLLAIALSAPAFADNARAVTTVVLVARDEVTDPNFGRSVVLVMNNIGPAPAGVILNRPTNIAVARLFPEMENLARLPDKVYFGGPVERGTVSFVFRASSPPDKASPVVDGVYISTDESLLRKLLARDKPMQDLRIFMGYSGWSRGQLEGEIGRGDWRLEPADAQAIFQRRPEYPWPDKPAAPEGSGRQRT